MRNPPEVGAAISRGLAFLEKRQEADGSFISYSSASMRPFRRARSWQTTFVPALILGALAAVDEHRAWDIREKLAQFLLRQQDVNGSFNYWAKGAAEYTAQSYPNDLDDTFCALAGLHAHNPKLVDEAVLVQAIKLLVAAETAVGGPYRTWLVSSDSEPIWLDVDVAVNSNVAYFLSLVGSRLPALDEAMGKAIASGVFSSPYYPSPYVFLYYFARAYEGSNRADLLDRTRRLHEAAATDLDRALCLCARSRLGETRDTSDKVRELIAGQRGNGSWAAAALYADPVKNGKLYYNGSPALTTAFALEALALHTDAQQPRLSQGAAAHTTRERTAAALTLAKRQNRRLHPELRAVTSQLLDKLAASDSGPEIIALPQRFNRSLVKPLESESRSESFLNNLSVANINGWLAYTIYDDFLDGAGTPSLLPAANAAARRSFDGFSDAVTDDPAFRSLVRESFDAIDSANAWEQAHCRFERSGDRLFVEALPDYDRLSKLAERSLGHALAPLAVLVSTGCRPGGKPFKSVQTALSHYLIARQLNDDLHDWQSDLENGHVSYVVARIMSDLCLRPGTHDIRDLLPKARRQFWHETLPALCQTVREQIRLGRQALDASGLLVQNNVIAQLLDGFERTIDETLDSQRQAISFLRHYNKRGVMER